MRRSSTSLGRVLTFFSMALFLSSSFASPLHKRRADPSNTPHAPRFTTSTTTTSSSSSQFPTDTFSSTSSSTFTPVTPSTTSTPDVTTTSSATSTTLASFTDPPPPPITTSSTTSSSTTTSTTSTSSSSSTKSRTTSHTLTTPHSSTLSEIPQTTLYATYSNYVPITTSQRSVATPTSVVASATGFWRNKAAVGATFTFVSLIGVGILFALGAMFIKRQRSLRDSNSGYFEKYQDGTSDGHYEEPEPIVTEAMAPAPLDAYPDRQIHYGTTQPHQGYPDNRVVEFLPNAEYTPQIPPHEQESYYQGAYDNQPSQFIHSSSQTPNLFYPTTHPFNHPQNSTFAGLAPPVALRQPSARGSGYGQSIDSFYGASSIVDEYAGHAI